MTCLGFDRLWLLLAVALPALVCLIVPLPAVDLAYQVRVGEIILTTGRIPTADTFTFTVAGTPWVDQQWLAQVILALGHRAGGWELLAVLRAAVVALTFGLTAATALARGASPRNASILALVAFAVAAPALALRPQLLGIAIFAALGLLVATRDRYRRAYWLAPLLVVAWANAHGSVVLAPILLGYAWLDDVARGRAAGQSFAVLVAGALATLLSPLGPGVWTYAAGIGTNPEIAGRATEWQRTTPFTVTGLLFYLSALGALAIAVAGRARLGWPDWLWLIALFAIGAWTVRGVAWWPIGAVLVVAAALPLPRTGAVRPRPNRLNAFVAGLIVVALIVALPWVRPADTLTGRAGLLTYAPSGLAAALRERVRAGDRVFVPQAWASWFEWAVPEASYFVDSRFELFPADVWSDHDVIAAGGHAAEPALERWGIDALVAPPTSGPAVSGWRRAYADAEGAIYVTASP